MDVHFDARLKVKKQTVKASTLEIYTDLVDRSIRPTLGKKRLPNVGAADIQGLYAALAEQGYGRRTNELIHVVIINIFKLAEKWDLLCKNPMSAVENPRHVKQEMRVMTIE